MFINLTLANFKRFAFLFLVFSVVFYVAVCCGADDGTQGEDERRFLDLLVGKCDLTEFKSPRGIDDGKLTCFQCGIALVEEIYLSV